MFTELAKGCISDKLVCETYGLLDGYEYMDCEISQLEPKPEPIPECGIIYI